MSPIAVVIVVIAIAAVVWVACRLYYRRKRLEVAHPPQSEDAANDPNDPQNDVEPVASPEYDDNNNNTYSNNNYYNHNMNYTYTPQQPLPPPPAASDSPQAAFGQYPGYYNYVPVETFAKPAPAQLPTPQQMYYYGIPQEQIAPSGSTQPHGYGL